MLFKVIPLHFQFVSIIVCLFAVGCGDSPKIDTSVGELSKQLADLETRYRAFCDQHSRPPNSPEEVDLPPDFEIISDRDKKPMQIYWGTPVISSKPDVVLVIAHETEGTQRGKLSLTSQGIMNMTEGMFREAVVGDQPASE